MIHSIVPNYPRIPSNHDSKSSLGVAISRRGKSVSFGGNEGRVLRISSSNSSSSISTKEDLIGISEKDRDRNGKEEISEIIIKEYGWKVRKLNEEEEEDDDLRSVATIQAEAFHEPVFLFNYLFYQFFKAEVLAALIYRLKSYPPNRYACLVAEADNESNCEHHYKFVGVVDLTVAGDLKVKRYLPAGQNEYLFVSGIAVPETFRRRKVATVLLKGCDMLAKVWGFKFLALSAYEDDYGARNLYSKAGYEVISSDPLWKSSWIGRKRCVTMLKEL